MGFKLRSKRDVWVFTLALVLVGVCASLLIDMVSWSFQPAPRILIYGMIGAVLVTLPIAYFIGLQMLAISTLSAELERAARFDPLTGALTRAAFLSHAEGLVARPGVLIIVDIDNFKAFNDAHGHLAGDAALKQVAQKLSRCSRERDIVARFGGEEFLVLLPETTLAEGERVADELCAMLRQTPVIVTGKPVIVTASFGVAVVSPAEPVEHALYRADGALYQAKRAGRDTVRSAA